VTAILNTGPNAMIGYSMLRAISLAAPVLLLAACSGKEPAKDAAGAAPTAVTPAPAADPAAGAGTSLAFEWSANGFEQLPGQYTWSGSGTRDDMFQPHFALSVPETDDILWSSACEAGGDVVTQLYLAPPKGLKGNRARLRFETDVSGQTLDYDAKYNPSGQFEGFEIVQTAKDPMFADIQAGRWAYVQIGEGASATKLRISLAGAGKALRAFLPACAAPKKKAAAAMPPPATISYACKDGRTARATYLGNDTDTPIVRLEINGQRHLLSQIVSGSGARYDNSHEARGDKRRTWHSKGAGALLIESDWDDADGTSEITTHCTEEG
jgi:membrane-bound inhibitor of C-type lysozyme